MKRRDLRLLLVGPHALEALSNSYLRLIQAGVWWHFPTTHIYVVYKYICVAYKRERERRERERERERERKRERDRESLFLAKPFMSRLSESDGCVVYKQRLLARMRVQGGARWLSLRQTMKEHAR